MPGTGTTLLDGDPAAEALRALLSPVRGLVLFLTGAGVSAESGIPTFRGPEGYWRVGSRDYHPQELATFAAFSRMPDEVWGWYLHRRGVCRAAAPNAAHRAIVAAERALGDRFLLVTQNVDGLHVRAGNSRARTYAIHGDLDLARCARECAPEPYPIPEAIGEDHPRGQPIGDAARARLRCPRCGGPGRPHVLWFDERYDEPRYRWDSTIRAAFAADALVVVGTSGATTLPTRVVEIGARRAVPIVVVDPEPTPFGQLAAASARGLELRGAATRRVPEVVAALGVA